MVRQATEEYTRAAHLVKKGQLKERGDASHVRVPAGG